MENEDIFSSIWIVVIAIISIILRLIGNGAKQKQEQKAPATQSTSYEEEQESTTHSDSLETIFDEILGDHQRAAKTHTAAPIAKEQSQSVPDPKNARNRTSARKPKTTGITSTIDKKNNDNKSKKFNLREAVIYSEILTPKFKDGE